MTKDKITGPLFKWFGSKWLSSKTLPEPSYDSIVEPFAGSAGYSLRHFQFPVYLAERDFHIGRLWCWLIRSATEADIREIPLNIPEGTDIRNIGLTDGQSLLLKSWQRTNNVGNCWTVSPWGNKSGQWTENTRARVASEVNLIKHWKVVGSEWQETLGLNTMFRTWFIDPPYQFNYQYRLGGIDYNFLADNCLKIHGHVIVCEAADPKTGKYPNWLPFSFFGDRITSRRKAHNHHHSKELIFESLP